MFKKAIITALAASALVTAVASNASAGQYLRWGPNGYTDSYTDFTFGTWGGPTYSGTIWGQ